MRVTSGTDPRQGVAVVSTGAELRLESVEIPSLHPTVVPVLVHAPRPFVLVGIWTHRPHNAVAWAAMTARRRQPVTSPRVPRSLAGSYLWPGRDLRRTDGRCPVAAPARGRECQRQKARLTDGELGLDCRLEVVS